MVVRIAVGALGLVLDHLVPCRAAAAAIIPVPLTEITPEVEDQFGRVRDARAVGGAAGFVSGRISRGVQSIGETRDKVDAALPAVHVPAPSESPTAIPASLVVVASIIVAVQPVGGVAVAVVLVGPLVRAAAIVFGLPRLTAVPPVAALLHNRH